MGSEFKFAALIAGSFLLFLSIMFGAIAYTESENEETKRLCIKAGKLWDDGTCLTSKE